MPTVYPVPTQGTMQSGAALWDQSSQLRDRSLMLRRDAFQAFQDDLDRLYSAFAMLRQRRDQKKAEAKSKKKGFGGLAGTAVGAGLGYALAPATGGASAVLASTALGAGLGGAAGSAFDPNPSAGMQFSSSTSQALGRYGDYRAGVEYRNEMLPNPYYGGAGGGSYPSRRPGMMLAP